MRAIWRGTAAALLLLLALSLGARSSLVRAASLPPAATPEDALRMAVENQGGTYAGDCATTRSPQDLGKSCSRFIAAQGTLCGYLTGRTFSEYSAWMFVQVSPAGWVVVQIAPFGFADDPTRVPWPQQNLVAQGS
jgi:hypothetical protein